MNRRYGKLELDWGSVADVYFDVISSVNLNLELTSPECSLAAGTDAWVTKLVLTLLLPVFAAAALGVMVGVVAVLIKGGVGWFGTKNGGQLWPAFVRSWFQLLLLLYMPLTSAALSVFGCRKDESGRWVLAADPVRSCYTASWWAGLFPLGLVAVVTYAFAIPGGVVWRLTQKKRVLDEISFVLQYGFLVERFIAPAWWFSVAIMGRGLLVAICMTFFFTEEGKASSAVFALAASMLQLVYSRPYVSAFHNGLAIVVLGATVSVLFAGTFDDYTLRRVGVIGGISVNVVAIVGGNILDLWLISRREKAVERDEFYQTGVFRMEGQGGGGGGVEDRSFGDQVELESVGDGGGEQEVVLGMGSSVFVSSSEAVYDSVGVSA